MELGFRDLEIMFTSLLAKIPEAILLVDSSSTIVFANEFTGELFGYPDGTLPGSNLSRLIPKEFIASHHDDVTNYVEHEKTSRRMGENIRISGRKASGAVFPVEAMLTHIELDDGRNFGMAIIHDLSGQIAGERYMESYLTATAASFDKLQPLDALDYPVVVLDSEWNYLYINPAGTGRLGRSKGEVLGRNVWRLFPYLNGTEFEKKAKKALATQTKQTVEEYYPTSKTWYRTEMFPSSSTITLQILDITEHKQLASHNERLTKTLEEVLDSGPDRKNYRSH